MNQYQMMPYKVVVYKVESMTNFQKIHHICNSRQSKLLDTNELFNDGTVNIYFQNFDQAHDAQEELKSLKYNVELFQVVSGLQEITEEDDQNQENNKDEQ